jgi:probable phosphoglycerate mutase
MGLVFLAKSATTDFDEQDRIVGTLDVPLNVRGHAEVAELARELSGRSIDIVYATANTASQESAKLLAKHLGTNVKCLDELRNLDFGLWQGLCVAEVQRKHKRLFTRWKESPCTECPPAGEEVARVYERVERVIGPIIKKNSFQAIVIVAPDPLRKVIRCFLTERKVDNVLLSAASPNPVECIAVG